MGIDSALGSPERLMALDRTRLLDSPQDIDFDQLTRLASSLLRVPNALVTLVSSDRQYVKSASDDDPSGGNPPGSSQTLDLSFCKFAVASAEPFIVEDARDHPLVRDSEAVANGVIAYAGVPLEADGEAIGALCVIDSRPRSWSEEELATLRALARSAMQLIKEKAPEPTRVAALADEPAPILECVSLHLRNLAQYEQIVAHGDVDLSSEARARNDVVASFQKLGHALDAGQADSDPELRSLIARYVESEQQRAEATTKFAEGELSLLEVEGRIAIANDSLAALRIGTLDRGAEH
jgi:GAF domain-containing protein